MVAINSPSLAITLGYKCYSRQIHSRYVGYDGSQRFKWKLQKYHPTNCFGSCIVCILLYIACTFSQICSRIVFSNLHIYALNDWVCCAHRMKLSHFMPHVLNKKRTWLKQKYEYSWINLYRYVLMHVTYTCCRWLLLYWRNKSVMSRRDGMKLRKPAREGSKM